MRHNKPPLPGGGDVGEKPNQSSLFNPITNAYDLIPQELRNADQWCNFRLVSRGTDRPTKVPFQPNNRSASTTNRETWSSFDAVQAARSQFDGVGFIFAEDDPYVGIDLDHVLDPATGQVAPWASKIVTDLDTYAEVSLSGDGLHLFARGQLPKGKNRRTVDLQPWTPLGLPQGLEVYDRSRYFVMTGNHWAGSPTTIEDRPDELAAIHAECFPKSVSATREHPRSRPDPSRRLSDDDELILRASRAANAHKFVRLFQGDPSLHGDDDSAADAALCEMLAWWSDGDAMQVDRIFRRSGLMRDKWDKMRGASTYGERTVRFAIDHCGGGYGALRSDWTAATLPMGAS